MPTILWCRERFVLIASMHVIRNRVHMLTILWRGECLILIASWYVIIDYKVVDSFIYHFVVQRTLGSDSFLYVTRNSVHILTILSRKKYLVLVASLHVIRNRVHILTIMWWGKSLVLIASWYVIWWWVHNGTLWLWVHYSTLWVLVVAPVYGNVRISWKQFNLVLFS